MARTTLSRDDRQTLLGALRTPILTMIVSLLLLGLIVLLGVWLPFRKAWIIEAAATLTMVAIVLVVSMELPQEPPIIRFFALVGFAWVAILFTMTLVDYATR